MAGFGDDDFFANQNGYDRHDDGNHYGYNDEEPVQQTRTRTRQRRASVSGAAPLTRSKSSDDVLSGQQQTRIGSRRPEASDITSSDRSLENRHASSFNGQLEAVAGKGTRPKSGSSGDRSVSSGQSSNSGARRAGGTRRASLAAGASALTSRSAMQPRHQYNEEAEYGYGYEDNNRNAYEDDDNGYGYEVEQQQQPVVQEEPVRARRQRRCSIADVVNTASVQPTDYGYGDSTPDTAGGAADNYCPAPASRGIPVGASQRTGISNAAINNIAIPMMASEEPKRTNRRGSIAMLGNIGRNKASKEPEPINTKKPVADRDRHRQGTLLDRVGASSGDGRGSNKAGATSYSDRIMIASINNMNHRRASTGGVSNRMVVTVGSNTINNNINHHMTQQQQQQQQQQTVLGTTTSFVVMQHHHHQGMGDDTTTTMIEQQQYPSSPEKNSGYQEEGDSDENRQETVTIITYNAKNRTTRRASFSGPITRRRSTAGGVRVTSTQASSSHDGNHSHYNTDDVQHSFTKPVRTVSSSSHSGCHDQQQQAVITIQTSKGINPDIVARMSISKHANGTMNNGLVHLVDDDDDDDDDEMVEQNRRGYIMSGTSSHDMMYGLTKQPSSTLSQHQGTTSNRRMQRRGSNASSVHSKSSRTSRRRSSMDRRTFKSKDPLAAANVYTNNKSIDFSTIAYDTDDPMDNDDDISYIEDADEHGGKANNNAVDTFGYESDAASEHSRTESLSSSKRLRRNSCIIRNEQDFLNTGNGSVAFTGGSVIAMHNRSRIDFDIEEDEDDDPDSLFNRAKRRSQSMDLSPLPPPPSSSSTTQPAAPNTNMVESFRSSTPKGTERVARVLSKRNANEFINGTNVTEVTSDKKSVEVTSCMSIDVPVSKQLQQQQQQPQEVPMEPFRKSPLTVSYEPPTEANLRANLQNMLRIDKFSGNNALALSPVKSPKRKSFISHNPIDTDGGGWGGGDITTSRSDDKDDDDDESSYGANMYTDTMVYADDVDIHDQKARRRASLDNTYYDIDAMSQMKGIKVPHFKPVDGCRNASDFIVRSFTARMRISGFTVLKHNRSRWSKAKNRIIYLLPDSQTLSWRPSEEETKAGGKNDVSLSNKVPNKNDKDNDESPNRLNGNNMNGPKVDLSKCIEVRYACSVDPKNPKKRGTPVLRARCKDELAGKSFSLIFPNRTLDLTAFSNDQCRILMEGFSALCFRLHLQKMENNKNSDSDTDTKSKMHMNSSDDRCSNIDDDWASTKFGGSTTESHSYPVGPSPWGR